MKRWYVVAVSVLLVSILTACGGNDSKDKVDTSKVESSPTVEVSPESSADTGKDAGTNSEPIKEAVAEKEEKMYKSGEQFSLVDWDITLDSFEFKQEVSDDMFSSSAAEGSKYLVLNYTVTNNGKSASDFTSMFDGIKMKALFKGEYEYNYSVTMIKGDLSQAGIKPLEKKSGFVVMEVPDTVADSTESLTVTIEEDGEKAQLFLR